MFSVQPPNRPGRTRITGLHEMPCRDEKTPPAVFLECTFAVDYPKQPQHLPNRRPPQARRLSSERLNGLVQEHLRTHKCPGVSVPNVSSSASPPDFVVEIAFNSYPETQHTIGKILFSNTIPVAKSLGSSLVEVRPSVYVLQQSPLRRFDTQKIHRRCAPRKPYEMRTTRILRVASSTSHICRTQKINRIVAPCAHARATNALAWDRLGERFNARVQARYLSRNCILMQHALGHAALHVGLCCAKGFDRRFPVAHANGLFHLANRGANATDP